MPSEQGKKPAFGPQTGPRLIGGEGLDQLISLTRSGGWLGLIAAGAVLAAALWWGFAGGIPMTVSGRGILLAGTGISEINSPADGQVNRIAVRPGQTIRAGQELAAIDQPRLKTQLEQLKEHLAQTLDLQTELPARPQENGPALDRLKIEINTARWNIKRLETALRLGGRVVAPRAGRVAEVFLSAGQPVARGQSMLSYQADSETEAKLEAVVYVPAVDSQVIRPGLPVSLAPWTYDRTRHGLLPGKVKSVIRYPASRRGMLNLLKNEDLVREMDGRSPVIALRVSLDPPSASSPGPKAADLNGSLCDAVITFDRQRPIAYLFPWLR